MLVCRVTAINQTGSVSADSAGLAIKGGSGGGSGQRLSKLRLRPDAFRAARKGLRQKAGTTVSFADTGAGTVTFTVQRRHQCRKHAKRCARWTKVKRFTFGAVTGTDRFHFSARGLRPGRYRLLATAAGGNALTVGFRILPR
jgi:hypothetical protein